MVGGNGAGKTTLIGMLLGEIEPDVGAVHRPNDLQIGYLPQDLADDPQGTVLEEAMAGDERMREARNRLAELEKRLTESSGDDPDLIHDYGEAQSPFEQLGGYSLEADAHRVLAGLGFKASDSRPPVHRALRRLAHARRACPAPAVAKPDVLVLDEPTNHLDVDSRRLARAAAARLVAGAVLFVSHDRDFIDAVAERVIELAGGTATEYVGGFAEFVVAARGAARAAEAAAAARHARSPRSSASSSGSATRPPRPARCRAASRRSRSSNASRCPTARSSSPSSRFPEAAALVARSSSRSTTSRSATTAKRS